MTFHSNLGLYAISSLILEQCSEHILLSTFTPSVDTICNEKNNDKCTSEHSAKLKGQNKHLVEQPDSYNGGNSCTVESIIASL